MILFQFGIRKREVENILVSTQALKLKALRLIKPVVPKFKASHGWDRGFLRCNNLLLRTKTSIAHLVTLRTKFVSLDVM